MGAHGNMYILLDTGSYKENNQIKLTNCEDTHFRTPRSAAADLCLCCLPMSHKQDAGVKWVSNLMLKDK